MTLFLNVLTFIHFIRFKLHLLIKDETGETKIMLLDTIAERVVGVSAEVLLDGSLEEVYTSLKLNFFSDGFFFGLSFINLEFSIYAI